MKALNPQPDDEQWLRRIGATTADAADAADDAADAGIDDPPIDPIADLAIVDLDMDPTNSDTTTDNDPTPHAAKRFTPWVAAVFGAVALTATATTAGAAALASRDSAPPAPSHPSLSARPPAPTLAPPTSENADAAIPFTASADCPPGSTAAQSLADPQAKSPWICARIVDGQVLALDLGRAYIITAVSIIPGATTDGDDQADPWLQHRVVTRIQWQFNDIDKTVRNQNTGNVRGEAAMPVPNLLASAITVIIQQTSRPPATAPTTRASAPAGDGLLGPILGTTPTTEPPPAGLPGDTPPPDPSDGTFAVTSLKVIGHRAT